MQQLRRLAPAMMAALLCGCAIARPDAPALFDLGIPRPAQNAGPAQLPPLALADIVAPTWLDRPQMVYRLNYDNDQQPRSYTQSRWSMPPAELISQRVKARIAQAGGVMLSAADGVTGVPMLRIEADDFSQVFDTVDKSEGRVALRASVFSGRMLVGQKSFIRSVSAPSADAVGGARALAAATDAAIADIIAWLATLPLKQ